MALNPVGGPLAEPLHLDEAKAHLRVTDVNSDALIAILISVARQRVENFTHRALMLQIWEQAMDAFQACIRPMRSPLRSVVSISYLDANGAAQTLATTEYTVDKKSEPARIAEAYGKSWPVTQDELNAVMVTFKAGYLTPFTANATTDTLTAKGHVHVNGDLIRLSNSGGASRALPGGLAENTDYYAINVSGDTLQLSLTPAGATVDITNTGTGAHYLGELPAELRQAMLLILGELYERREEAIAGASIMQVPLNSIYLLWPHRVVA